MSCRHMIEEGRATMIRHRLSLRNSIAATATPPPPLAARAHDGIKRLSAAAGISTMGTTRPSGTCRIIYPLSFEIERRR